MLLLRLRGLGIFIRRSRQSTNHLKYIYGIFSSSTTPIVPRMVSIYGGTASVIEPCFRRNECTKLTERRFRTVAN